MEIAKKLKLQGQKVVFRATETIILAETSLKEA